MTWLENIDHVACSQHSSRRGVEPDTLVIHYSATGGSAHRMAGNFAKRPQRGASYHIITDRDGDDVQCVPLDRASWHARGIAVGDERYRPGANNRRSIGWCFVNKGWAVDDDEAGTVLAHEDKSKRTMRWQTYPPAQIVAFRARLVRVLEAVPSIRYVTGHGDAAFGKVDPGPAFPWFDALGGTGLIVATNTWPEGRKGPASWVYVTMR